MEGVSDHVVSSLHDNHNSYECGKPSQSYSKETMMLGNWHCKVSSGTFECRKLKPLFSTYPDSRRSEMNFKE